MKKQLLTIGLLCAITFSGQAQGLKNIAFGKITTGTSAFDVRTECSYSDNSGNIFLAGASQDAADFDVFHPYATTFGPTGLYLYFNKYDASGVLQFTKYLSSTTTTTNPEVGVRGIVTDAAGNIYITGTFNGTTDFDPSGATANISTTTGQAFLAKYNSNGDFLWVRNFGGISGGNKIVPGDIAINPTADGKIYIAGWYRSDNLNGTKVDFNPGVPNTSTVGNGQAKCSFFAAYLASNGDFVTNSLWSASSAFTQETSPAPTYFDVEAKSIQFDKANNIYAVGEFENSFDAGTIVFHKGTRTGFLIKKPTTTAGNASDATGIAIGTAIYDIDLDASNNVYVGGIFSSLQGMVAKYNSSLVQTWIKYPAYSIMSLAVNASNQIIAVGNGWNIDPDGTGHPYNFAQLYNSSGTLNFGANGLKIMSSPYYTQETSEVQVVGNNFLIGGDFYTSGGNILLYGNQDIGYNNETINVYNSNPYNNQFWGIYSPDFVGPVATITTTAPNPTSASPIPITITFDEEPYLFDASAFGTTNANISNLVQTGALTYTADLTPITFGPVQCEIFGTMFFDNQNNQNQGSNSFTITYDLPDAVPPTVSITSPSGNPTNVSPIHTVFTFSETVTGFTLADISVANGTSGNFVAISGTAYSADITPSAQGTVSVNVLANICIDVASNQNTASNTLTRTFDNVAPTLVVSSTSANLTNISPIPVTFTFIEPVTGFSSVDVTIVNGTITNFAGGGTTYTADITPLAQGPVSVSVLANVCIDAALNQNTASNTLSRTFDNAAPTVVVSSTSANPTNVSPIPVTFTFSETVTGFTLADISVTNGTAGTFVALSGTVYTANITPSGQSLVSINVPANLCADATFNQNTASNTLARNYDAVSPNVVITSISSDPSNVSPIPVTITFSETVTGFTLADISVTNGTPGTFVALSGTVYTANITPSAQGPVAINVLANVCIDAASNQNIVSNTLVRTFDTIAPSVTVSSASANPTNVSPIPVTFTFSEAVTGFALADISVNNGTAGSFVALSGTTYTANITPSAQGLVSIEVLANLCVDAASNQNTASNTLTRNYNAVNPTVVIASISSDPTNVSPIPVAFTFSATVTGFAIADISVTNGAAGNFVALSGTVYSANITPSAPGLVSINVSANVCTDAASNQNAASNTLSRTFDNAAPSVTVSSTSANATNVSPIPVTFTFSETVTGFALADISVTNGTAGSFVALSGTVYTANITPSAQGPVSINVLANVCVDGASNQNIVSNTLARTFDNIAPSVNVSSASANPTNVSPIPVTFTFSEAITGFALADISVTNGTAGNFVALSGTAYTANITPSAQGLVSIEVLANLCVDAASNQNIASNILTRNYNAVNPTVVVTSISSDPTNVSPIPVTFTFSAPVTGFTIADISVTTGAAGNFVALSGTVYTANITPSAPGPVSINVLANVCTDAASNQNAASNTLNRTYDNAAPSVTVSSASANPTNVSPIPVTFTFSEAITGFAPADISLTNGTAGNFVAISGTVYTANITPSGQGPVKINVFANVCADAASNQNTASNTLIWNYDAVNPTLVIASISSDPTNVSPIPVTFTFSEAVTGFAIADITVTNGTAGSFVALSGTVYTADITPSAQGLVSVNVLANVCVDAASNQNTVSNTLTRNYTTVNPTVVITSISSDPTNVSTIPVTFTFSASVTGFTLADISVTNGTAGNFVALSGTVYTADITPSAQGLVSVNVLANVCADATSNQNTASNTVTRSYDNAIPSVTVSSASSNLTNVSPIPVTFTFSEDVTGFALADISVTNGTASSFVALSGTVYTADITPSAQGLVSINVLANVCADAASNQNTASNTLSRTLDNAAPSVTVSSTSSNPIKISLIPVTFTFSEPVTEFTLADISVTNGAATNFVAQSTTVYTANITPVAQGQVSINVLANVCIDAASNQNTASNTISRKFDNVAPSVTITSTSANPTNVSQIKVTFTFSETVAGFTLADISVTNGTAGSFVAVSGAIYTANITTFALAQVSINVLANVCVDAASNQNAASNTLSWNYDAVNPTVVITSSATNPTLLSPIPLTFTFSEIVTGFTISDLTVGNGTPSNFSGSGSVYTVDITPLSAGSVTINIAGSTYFDNATNPNALAANYSIVYQTTGVAGIYASNILNLYPNPSSEKITVVLQQKGLLEIYNVLGQKVLEKRVDSNETLQELYITKEGSYICKFSSSNKTDNIKFIITKQ
jgi:hypothetical protein